MHPALLKAARRPGFPLLTLAALLLAGLAQVAVAGTPGVDLPPLPGPTPPVAVPQVHEERLPNGLTLIVVPRPGVPLVSARLLLRGGALADPPRRAGLAELTANLLGKGAWRGGRRVDAATLARQAEALGASLDTGAGATSLGVAMTVTTPHLDEALALIADVVRRPLLAANELERSRAQMADGLRLALADPSALASMVARRVHWGASPEGAVTTPASLARLTPTDVRAFHRRWARPDQAALLLSGDVDLPRARRLAQRWFGSWPQPGGPAPVVEAREPVSQAASTVLLQLPGAGQSSVALVGGFSTQGDDDRRIGHVANAVLGGGYSSRLNQEVRIRRGLAYGAGSRGEAAERGGMWLARTQTDHRNAPQVLQVMRAEVARLAEQPPGAEELAARKASLVGGFARQLETTAGLGAAVGELWVQRRPPESLGTLPAQIEAVQAAQVADYARRRWAAATLRAVVVGDLAEVAPEPGFDPQALRLDVAELDLERPDLRSPRR